MHIGILIIYFVPIKVSIKLHFFLLQKQFITFLLHRLALLKFVKHLMYFEECNQTCKCELFSLTAVRPYIAEI